MDRLMVRLKEGMLAWFGIEGMPRRMVGESDGCCRGLERRRKK